MKRIIFIIIPFFLGVILSAQTPPSFRYQAVARNNSGIILNNQPVSFRISILSGSVSGTITYRETHTGLTTNAFGLVELEIGKGTPVNGTFSAINWDSNSYFVQVEIDPAGGTSYQTLSTSQLLSVPYALHARTVETGDNWGSQTVNVNSTITGNGTVSTPLGIADNGVNSAKIQNGAVISDKLASNSVTDAKIAAGAVTGAKIAQGGATSGQALKWNGTAWAPGNDEFGGLTLPYEGTAITTEAEASAFKVSNSADLGIAITGFASATTSSTIGIVGRSDSNTGIGVVGVASSTGTNFGVQGRSSSTSGTGVQGEATALSGATEGVTGRSSSTSGTGVFGTASAASGYTHGVFGSTVSPNGRAVGARSISSTGTTYGVHSQVLSSAGFSGYFTGGKFHVSGNVGIGTESPGYRLDVYAPTNSNTGIAVFRNYSGQSKIELRQNSNGAGALELNNSGGTATVLLSGNGANYINGGNLGIGTSFPTEALYVVGNAVKTVGGTVWLTSSDLRLKNILGNYHKGLDEIVLLQTVRYQYKTDNPRQLDSNEEQVGFIAQEVQKIFPESVSEGPDGYLDFNMHAINIALVNAIKELKSENDRLKSENEKVNTRLEKIEAMINSTVKN